jgi:alkanesulfonate monooxygenase SsuD/methylene tetrahydromethanopterin reductase-like flavin-dependent oxidoreductase (luciferase family)
MEYAHFGIPMEESRDRFDESVAMVLTALRTGVIEGEGPYYPQIRTPIHPRPRPELADKFFSVGMSGESAAVAGKIGARLLGFVTKPIAGMMPLFDEYLNAFKAAGHTHTPHIVLDDFFYVADSADEALERGTQYLNAYFSTVMDHYEMAGSHFDTTKGYAAHAETARAMRSTSFENAAAAYCACQVGFGTPDQILAKLEERFRALGPEISMAGCFFFGGMQRDQAEASMRLFGKKVIPAARDLARSYAREPEYA